MARGHRSWQRQAEIGALVLVGGMENDVTWGELVAPRSSRYDGVWAGELRHSLGPCSSHSHSGQDRLLVLLHCFSGLCHHQSHPGPAPLELRSQGGSELSSVLRCKPLPKSVSRSVACLCFSTASLPEADVALGHSALQFCQPGAQRQVTVNCMLSSMAGF